MHRRLRGLVDRAGLNTFVDYFARLEQDEAELAQLLDRMTINVSELFRNPERWADLRSCLLPPMLARKQRLRVWSAGCSYGAEPFSLAILLDEHTPGVIHTIHATDLDGNMLKRGREGWFCRDDVRNVPEDILARYLCAAETGDTLPANQRYQIVSPIRWRIQFKRHNLLADPFERRLDLICCRNVVIYFGEEAKDGLYRRFYNALAPGGILFVGATERVVDYRDIGYEAVMPQFYRKPMELRANDEAAKGPTSEYRATTVVCRSGDIDPAQPCLRSAGVQNAAGIAAGEPQCRNGC
jgi:chemotaxis protein methyltransferase CheR